MHNAFSPQPAGDRVRIEIRRGSEPATGFDVALSEAASLCSIAQASGRAMGFSRFVAFNRLHRSPELWLTITLAGLRLALAPPFDRRAAAARKERLLQQAAADAAVLRAARIAAIDRLRAGLAAAWSRLSPARLLAAPSPRPAAPLPTALRLQQLDAVDRHRDR